MSKIEKLWIPGMHLSEEYPVPNDMELVKAWETYSGRPAHALQGAYGVYNEARSVTAVASIDLCDMLRETAISLGEVTGFREGRRHLYGAGSWFDKSVVAPEYNQSVVTTSLQVLMTEGLVPPVESYELLASTMQRWRKLGIYCVANSSTLPGCEMGTIEHTLTRDYPGCFDALILPRNHFGDGSVTNAEALTILSNEAGIDLDSLPVVHIDDAPHHIVGFKERYGDQVKLLLPLHQDNGSAPADTHVESVAAAFEIADAHLSGRTA